MKVSHRLRSLFTSQTRSKLLTILFSKVSEPFYVRELVRLTEEEINSVRRELDNLKKANLIASEARGNRLYYWANRDHFLSYLLQIMATQQSAPFSLLIENKSRIGSMKLILVSQDFLNSASKSGLDMIIVGDVNLKPIEEIIHQEEEKRQTEINYMVMDKSEFHVRQLKRDPILVEFLLKMPAVIYGNPEN